MAVSQLRSRRKSTGGLYKPFRKKRKYELGRKPAQTKLEVKKRVLKIRCLGGNRKLRLLGALTANLYDPKSRKYEQVKIKTIVENAANRHFVRRNIITKGCVIDTEKGRAKVMSRPGQDGLVNAVLVS